MLKPTITLIATLSLAGCLADEPDTPTISTTRDVVVTETRGVPFCRGHVSIRYFDKASPEVPLIHVRGAHSSVAYPTTRFSDGTYRAYFAVSPSIHVEFQLSPGDRIEGLWGHPVGNLTVTSERDYWSWSGAFDRGVLECDSRYCEDLRPWIDLELAPCPKV